MATKTIKVRLKIKMMTAAEWAEKNPVLLKGEVGFVEGTTPMKFKVGDGTKTWSALGWSQPTELVQLAGRRHAPPCHGYPDRGLERQGRENARHACGRRSDVRGRQDETRRHCRRGEQLPAPGQSSGLDDNTGHHAPLRNGCGKGQVEPRIHHREGGHRERFRIDLPFEERRYQSRRVDQHSARSSVARFVDQDRYDGEHALYRGEAGDKYVEFLFQNNNTPQYLPVQDLVDVYTGDGTYIEVSASNVIQLKYDALKNRLKTDFDAIYDAKGAAEAYLTDEENVFIFDGNA